MDLVMTPTRTPFLVALGQVWPAHKPRVTGALIASLTLGLAPFFPHAHVWKQLVQLARGTLTEPMDIFDLVLHGAPWVALLGTLAQLLWATLGAARRGRVAPAPRVGAP